MEKKKPLDDLTFDLNFDPATAETIRELHIAKEKAVRGAGKTCIWSSETFNAAEDYDTAKRLKESIDNLKEVGSRVAKLELRKRAAVQAEDYDTAKQLKIEIDKLRQVNELSKQEPAPVQSVLQTVPSFLVAWGETVGSNFDPKQSKHCCKTHPLSIFSKKNSTCDPVCTYPLPGILSHLRAFLFSVLKPNRLRQKKKSMGLISQQGVAEVEARSPLDHQRSSTSPIFGKTQFFSKKNPALKFIFHCEKT